MNLDKGGPDNYTTLVSLYKNYTCKFDNNVVDL